MSDKKQYLERSEPHGQAGSDDDPRSWGTDGAAVSDHLAVSPALSPLSLFPFYPPLPPALPPLPESAPKLSVNDRNPSLEAKFPNCHYACSATAPVLHRSRQHGWVWSGMAMVWMVEWMDPVISACENQIKFGWRIGREQC